MRAPFVTPIHINSVLKGKPLEQLLATKKGPYFYDPFFLLEGVIQLSNFASVIKMLFNSSSVLA